MKKVELTIAVGATESQWVTAHEIFGGDVDADLYVMSRIVCPSALPSITSLGIETEYGGVTKTVKDEYGVAASIAVSANADVGLRPSVYATVPPKFRLKANTAATSADRTFVIYFRKA